MFGRGAAPSPAAHKTMTQVNAISFFMVMIVMFFGVLLIGVEFRRLTDDVVEGKIQSVRIVRNPDKLAHL